MLRPSSMVCVLFFLLGSLAHGQTTRLVPEEYPTIQAAIVAALDGDTVLVQPGTYVERLDYIGKQIAVRSRKGAFETTIFGDHGGTVVRFASGEGRDALLEGFTIAGGYLQGPGAGIYILQGAPTIRNCIVRNNDAVYSDGGGLYSVAGRPLVQNCIFRNNDATWDGSGLFFRSPHDDWALVVNCVVYRNKSFAGGIFGALGSVEGARVLVANTISRENINDFDMWIEPPGMVIHSNFGGAQPTNGNINANPMFLSPTGGDFHLRAASPCRDAGTRVLPVPGSMGGLPTFDFEGDLRMIGAAPDMGVDEYTPRLTHSGTPAPGATIQFRLIGAAPGTLCSGWMSSALASPPLPTDFGPFFLADRRITLFDELTMPSAEVLTVPFTIPAFTPHPPTLFAQALAGQQFSNLDVVRD